MSNQATDKDSVPMRALTVQEMHDVEMGIREGLMQHVRSFCEYPSQGNIEGVGELLHRYQTAWMNGRKRVVTIG